MWCDQAKSVWSRLDSFFFFNQLIVCTTLNATFCRKPHWNWTFGFQRYGQLKGCKNNKEQKILCPLFGYILESKFLTSDWFCLITPHGFILVSKLTRKCLSYFLLLFCAQRGSTWTQPFLSTSRRNFGTKLAPYLYTPKTTINQQKEH